MTLTQKQKNIAGIALRMKETKKYYTRKQLRIEFGLGHNLTLAVFKELESSPIYEVKHAFGTGVLANSLKVMAVNYTEPVKPYDSKAGKDAYIAKANRFWDLALNVHAPQGA